ncbi:MAG TPA: serine/threonine-protein kinase [Archangium sp.]|jgi:serine/threonine-protein kinase|uniref:serine/threonine protein kinase n=1 Tax=Archangium sp. TaxID=1872627 RepID=UPI002ED80800
MSSTYRLTGRVEAGELAELYEAVQEPEGIRVVIKLFTPKTSDPRYAGVMAGTYGVLNPLHSDGIVHVVDMGFVKDRLAVVRESVDGHSLGTALQRLNTKEVILPPSIALSIVIQLLEAVERAHAVGVVHGAITPGNVLLSRAGQPAVCDFGALQALMAVPELKRAFVGRGRSAYRAPEVGRGDMPDVLSDIYSIGAIAYELLTLREAVIPEGGVSTRRAGLPPPSRLDRRIHARLDPIILRALEPIPSRRFRSCGEFASALRNCLSTNGGLPGGEESRRFVAELFPNEVSLGALGPVPFSERFGLTPVSGVSLAQVSADALDKSVVVRPSFSPALSEADTMEAPPAFEEYRPEPTVFPAATPAPVPAPVPVLDRRILDSTHILTQGTVLPREVPGEDEQTWVAPPGAAPKARRAAVVMGGAAAKEGTRVGKNPRLRMVEDFSRPEPSAVPEGDEEDRIDTAKLEPEPKLEPTLVRSRVSEGTVSRSRPPPDRSSYIPMPPPTAPDMPAVGGKRLFTEERNLLADARRRRRMLVLVGVTALVGVVFFALGVWKFSQRPESEPDPKVSAVSGAVEQYLQQPVQPPPAPVPSKPRPAPSQESEGASTPNAAEESRKPGLGYVSISANRPARAYIDGVRVKRNLPLVRYPVRPGTREIIVETLGLPRQRELFEVRLERGEHKKLEQLFPTASR